MLHNLIQLSLNSGSTQVQSLLWQWFWLEMRLKAFCQLTIPRKKKSSSSLTSSLSSLLILIKIFGIFFSEIKNCYYEIIRKTVSPGKTNRLVSPGESPDKYMMDFILNKVTRISWSRTLPKMSIIPVQHQEFCLYFKRTN